jgi:hypothetical protein
MNIYWFIILFVIWYALAIFVSERFGRQRKIGEEWSFFLSMLFSPVIGLLITLMTRPKN